MNKPNVLIACEESQAVTIEMRKLGINAFSCDIQECSGGHPEWHICEDVLPLLNGNCKFKTIDGTEHHINGKWDMIIAFPPCFVAGTKIMTKDGIKSIENVNIGDEVLTHKGRYRRVTDVMVKPTNKIVSVKAENLGEVTCTPNHRFYVKESHRYIKNNKRCFELSDFKWVDVQHFKHTQKNKGEPYTENTYLSSVSDTIYELPEYNGVLIGSNSYTKKISKKIDVDNLDFWYVVGRWVGDGFYNYKYFNGNKSLYGIKICCNKNSTKYLKDKIEKAGFTYYLANERTVDRFEISSKELGIFMSQFGAGAEDKHIPGFVTRLPREHALSFLNGYFESDGHITDRRIEYCSISKDLVYGIKYMINKYLQLPCTIKVDNNNRNIIEGRTVNAKTIYYGYAPNKVNDKSHFIKEDNYLLAQIREINYKDEVVDVYNLSVEEDESYTANGVVVHNCTHLAVSGAPHFKKKRADGRQKEGIEFFCQFLNADCERIVIENPVNIISGDYVKKWFPELAEKYGLPKDPTQRIHPWMFGDNFSKNTCLWIKGLNKLIPKITEEPQMEWKEWIDKKTGKIKRQNKWYYDALINSKTAEERSRIRSKTFPGIAKAMAEQFGKTLLTE